MRFSKRSDTLPDLTGARVMLRPLRVDDWDAWRAVRLRSRDFLERWEPRPDEGAPDPVLDREAFRSRCGAWERQRHFDAAYGFGVFVRDDDRAALDDDWRPHAGRFLGEVSLGSVQRGPFQTASLGYWIDEPWAGRGLVPEAVVVLLRYSFEVLGLHRIEAAIVPRNASSRRVADKLGLRNEGTARAYLQIQGVYEDHVRFAITAEEWRARRSELLALLAAPGPARQA